MKETLNSRVAVLETQVNSIDKKLDELRADVKDMHECLDNTRDLIVEQIQGLKSEENVAHKDLTTRITALEQWRWYILGIAAAVGYLISHADLVKNLIT
jgi:uncharacterized coiled-coil DUF342 family protein